MKKSLNLILCILCLIILLLSLTGCDVFEDHKESLPQKVDSEISYIDSQLISIINELNNINYAKYIVEVQEIKNTAESSGGPQSEGGSSKQASEEKNTNESGEESGGSSSGGEQQGGSESSSQSESKGSQSSNKNFSMKANSILGKEKKVSWDQLKNKIQDMYTAWTTVSMDLKEIGVPAEQLTEFSNDIDMVAVAIKNEDKDGTMDAVIKLYEYLPKFVDVYGENNVKNVLECKYSLLMCYKYADLEDWEQLQSSVNNLKMSFSNIANQRDKFEGREVNINSANVIINEMGNSANVEEKDVFFIKYKNLIQELNIIMSV